jgi:hypothetical protein
MANDNTNANNTVPGSWVEDEAARTAGAYTADYEDERAGDTVAHDNNTPDDQFQDCVDQEDLRGDSTAQDSVDLQFNGQGPQASSEIRLRASSKLAILEPYMVAETNPRSLRFG